jgi:endo-1,4-beta-xylanase
MVQLQHILAAGLSAASGVAAVPAFGRPLDLFHKINETESNLQGRDVNVSPGTGTHNGFFYSYWTDGQGSVPYNNGPAGSYDTRWSNVG